MKHLLSIILLIVFMANAVIGNMPPPIPSSNVYNFQVLETINGYTFYCMKSFDENSEILSTGTDYYVRGEIGYGDKEIGKAIDDPERSLKVWAKNESTGMNTDTLLFCGYYTGFHDDGYHTVNKNVTIKSISKNKIIYSIHKIKEDEKKEVIPFSNSLNNNDPNQLLVLLSFLGLLTLTILFFYRLRWQQKYV